MALQTLELRIGKSKTKVVDLISERHLKVCVVKSSIRSEENNGYLPMTQYEVWLEKSVLRKTLNNFEHFFRCCKRIRKVVFGLFYVQYFMGNLMARCSLIMKLGQFSICWKHGRKIVTETIFQAYKHKNSFSKILISSTIRGIPLMIINVSIS